MEGVATVDTSKHQMGEITQGVSLRTVRKRMRIEPLGMFSFKEQSEKTKKEIWRRKQGTTQLERKTTSRDEEPPRTEAG